MPNKAKPSFLVIFLPVLMKISDIHAAIIKNILAMKNREISATLNGAIKAMIPSTNVDEIITDPIKSPKTSQFCSFLAEIMEKYASGKQFPNATIRIPTRATDIPNFSEKNWAELTTACEAAKSSSSKIIIFRIWIKKILNPLAGVSKLAEYVLLKRSFFEKSQKLYIRKDTIRMAPSILLRSLSKISAKGNIAIIVVKTALFCTI